MIAFEDQCTPCPDSYVTELSTQRINLKIRLQGSLRLEDDSSSWSSLSWERQWRGVMEVERVDVIPELRFPVIHVRLNPPQCSCES